MSDLGAVRPSGTPTRGDLRAQADTQILQLLEAGGKSSNLLIAQAAADIAKARQRHEERMDAKLSPNVAAILATLVAVLVAAAAWYALVRYPGALGREIAGLVGAVGMLALCCYGLLSGHLNQENFMADCESDGGPSESTKPGPVVRGRGVEQG